MFKLSLVASDISLNVRSRHDLLYRFDRMISWKMTSLHKDIWIINLQYSLYVGKRLQWISAVTLNKASPRGLGKGLDFYPLFCRPYWIPCFRNLGTKVRHVSSFLNFDWLLQTNIGLAVCTNSRSVLLRSLEVNRELVLSPKYVLLFNYFTLCVLYIAIYPKSCNRGQKDKFISKKRAWSQFPAFSVDTLRIIMAAEASPLKVKKILSDLYL